VAVVVAERGAWALPPSSPPLCHHHRHNNIVIIEASAFTGWTPRGRAAALLWWLRALPESGPCKGGIRAVWSSWNIKAKVASVFVFRLSAKEQTMSSGVQCTDECVTKFNELKLKVLPRVSFPNQNRFSTLT
jgi:hypothetical protein